MPKPYKIGVVGAGNIGTAMAALLSQSDADVWITARGARLEQIKTDGIHLDDRGHKISARPNASSQLIEPMDAIFVCVKSQSLTQAILANRAAITKSTLIIPMVNGLPFWFYANESAIGNVPRQDPNGDLARLLAPQQVLGAVLLMTVQTDDTGVAKSSNTPTLSLGAVCDGSDETKIADLLSYLASSGIKADIEPNIRQKVLVKLLANFATNPLSALTGAMLDDIGSTPNLCQMATDLADEFRSWAASEGFELPPNKWLVDLLNDAGPFPTSMLQDALAGKPLELDAICYAPFVLAKAKGLDLPVLNSLLSQLRTADHLPASKSQVADFLDYSQKTLTA